MAIVKVGLLLLLTAVVSSANVPSRIAGGEGTSIDYYPTAVQVDTLLGIFWSQGCAGSILTSRFILSSASCFTGTLFTPRFRRVRAGSSYRNSYGQVVNVEEAINHPDFGLNGRDSDISVVRLEESLIYSPVVQQATIVASGSVLPDNTRVIQIGWGATVTDLASPQLQETVVSVINREACATAYESLGGDNNVITENMICTGVANGGRGACTLDGGGPLYYDNNGNLIVVGVISFQEGCGNATFPSVNTAVSGFTNWILETVP